VVGLVLVALQMVFHVQTAIAGVFVVGMAGGAAGRGPDGEGSVNTGLTASSSGPGGADTGDDATQACYGRSRPRAQTPGPLKATVSTKRSQFQPLGGGVTLSHREPGLARCMAGLSRRRPPRRSIPMFAQGTLAFPAVAVVALAGCTRQALTESVTRTDSAGIAIVQSTAPQWEPDDAWRVTGPIVSVGTVEGAPETQLYRVRGVARLPDGRIVVANAGSSELRIYGSDGRWIRSIGGAGDGPGEFRNIRGMQVLVPDTLLVQDISRPRLTLFTTEGVLVESRRLASPYGRFRPPTYRLSDGRWLDLVQSTEIEGYQTRRNAWVIWSEGDATTDTLLTGDGYEYLLYFRYRGGQYIGRGGVSVPFGGQDLMALGPGRVALSDGAAYDIAVAEIDGRQWRVRRTIERRTVSADDVARFIDDYVARYPQERQRDVRSRFDGVTPPSVMPTHAALEFDAIGDLWVESFRLRWDHESPRMWSVFAPDGRWLCDVRIPEGLRVYEIGDDYVVGVETDTLGVEFVRVYELLKHRV